jgi:predicted nucleic acid-binding protein
MVYVFDSSMLYYIIRGRPTIIKERIKKALLAGDELVIPANVMDDVMRTTQKMNSPELEDHISHILEFFDIDFDSEKISKDIYKKLIKWLKKKRIDPRGIDLKTAAYTAARGGILVSAEKHKYDKIEGLKVEDWTM